MTTTSLRSSWLASLAAGAAVLLCGSANAQTQVKLHLDWIVNGYHAPFYAAQANGLYKAAGLGVTIIPGKGSVDAIRAVAAGNAEFGFADAATAVKSVAEGISVQTVAVFLQKSPKGIVSFANKNIKTPKDLEGKTIGLVPEDATAKTLPAFLSKNNVDPNKVKIVNHTFATHIPSLLSGKIDALPEYIIGAYIAAKNAGMGPVNWMSYDDLGIRTYANGIIIRPELGKSQPQTVRAFVKASLQGLDWAMKNVDAAIEIVAKHANTDKPTLKEQLVLAIPLMTSADTKANGLGHMTKDMWQQTQDVMIKYGGQPKAVPLETVYTVQFLK